MTAPVLPNSLARRLFLHRHALGEPPSGKASGAALLDLIRRLGFVQVDSINTVERAHHMILWTRRPAYRPGSLAHLLERERALFEHWTHDASVIPTEYLPFWHIRFARERARLQARYAQWQGGHFLEKLDEVKAHIAAHGPCGSGELGEEEGRSSGGWWEWHPSKTALEFLWRTGELAIRKRVNFAKIYDLAERVYPPLPALSEAEALDFAFAGALDRLGFATPGELRNFWGFGTPEEARDWCAASLAAGTITEIGVEGHDGAIRRAYARPGVLEEAAALPPAPARLRILSPFDPALRDRARAERLFGFHYRIEVFVPEPKRRYGYYVFPVLEGERLTGRLDARARRAEGVLQVAAFWPEPGVRMGKGRLARLEAELARLARFAGCEGVGFAPDWLREATPG